MDYTTEEVRKYSDKYFNGTNKKYFTSFTETTPKGNVIKGLICQNRNRFMGSLLILEVNDESVEQYVQSMPKLHYFEHKNTIPMTNSNKMNCYEKLDGSCLIIYPLKNKKGEIIEIVPKTRSRAVADNNFINLYDKVDKKPILDYYQKDDGVLFFELYGVLNQHMILHYDTGIDARLISAYDNQINCFVDSIEYFNFCNGYNFKLPDKVFTIQSSKSNDNEVFIVEFTSIKYNSYLSEKRYTYESVEECIKGLEELLETLNNNYNEVNNRICTEGVVLNYMGEYVKGYGFNRMLKVKPPSIKEKHISITGIPKNSIRKEVYKYFDEYGSDAEELYKTNPQHHTEYIERMLSEEYSTDMIQNSKKKIEDVFINILDSRIVPVSIHEVCSELFEEYGENKDIGYCMRMFAEKYPTKKKDSRLVYHILEKKYAKK